MRISIQFQVRKSLLPKRTGPCKIKKAQLNFNILIISYILVTMDKPKWVASQNHCFNLYCSNPWLSWSFNPLSSRYEGFTVHCTFIYNFIQISTYLVSWTIFFFNCFMSLFSCEISLSLLSSIEFNSSFCFSSCAWMLYKIQINLINLIILINIEAY